MTEETAVVEEAPKKRTTKSRQKSYFQTTKLHRFFLDDEVSYIEHKPLDEGAFEAYQDLTSTIKLDREGETTEVDMALGKTRKFLLERLVVNWNLVDENGEPLPFSHKHLANLPPHLIGDLVNDIYEKNPILSGIEATDDAGKET